jgi:hypothetical protein
MDSVDATLGVVLTAFLVLAPIAFDKGPTLLDKWIALLGFGLLVSIVARGLFLISAPEPNAVALSAKLLGDLKDPVSGTLEDVRCAISLAAGRRRARTNSDIRPRSASGDLVQLFAEDRQRLAGKRFHLGLALAVFLVLAGIIGWRDVVQSLPEDRGHVSVRIHRPAVARDDAASHSEADSRVRRSDVR